MSFGDFVLDVCLFIGGGFMIALSGGVLTSTAKRMSANIWLGALLGGVVLLLGFPVVYFAAWLFGWPGTDSFGDSYRSYVVVGGWIGGAAVYVGYIMWCAQFAVSEAVRLWKGPPYSLN